MDLKVIADALAARFTGVTANGESIAIGPTASLPNAITQGPALLVYPPSGVLTVVMGPRNTDVYDFPIRLLRDPLDVPARTDALYAWANAMRFKVEGNWDLDLAYVAQAFCTAMRVELDGEEYAGTKFDVVELIATVHINEIASGVAG